MKKVLLVLFTIALSTVAMSQTVEFEKLTHDFGKIKYGEPVTYDFVFTNTGKKPVVIESASASCGCTVPVKPETPTAPGKSNKITAGFNAMPAGKFDKNILVKVAGIDKPIELRITGEVLQQGTK